MILLKNFKKTIFFISFLLITNFPFPQPKTDFLCGIKSLLVVYKFFGINPDSQEISSLIKKYPDGMSMYALYKILNKKGLYTQGVKISLKELSTFYSGFVLLVAPDKELLPQIKRNGPDIRFEKYSQFKRKRKQNNI
ncbi:MAG: cysteine peptidase family C39 domain-containing protein [Candidatus Omnitrophica bacterium]|nr:cysteine peptidase family C39 domain-containing protein [Candidatus Omnitrophota bacterium]